MRLPPFHYLEPEDLSEALHLLELHGEECRILAGGTDLLVRMKQRLLRPGWVLSLKNLHELDYIRSGDEAICIGGRTSLARVLDSRIIAEKIPALHEAVRSIGAPTIQHYRGTLAGNLCQDTRCLHHNQSAFWRSTKQPCHKAGGRICYAREGSDRCRSTHQSDAAPALMALEARVVLSRRQGTRVLPLEDFYTTRGESPLAIEPGEILTEIQIPLPAQGSGSAYARISYRSAIDFPIAAAGVSVQVRKGRIQRARIVVGAVASAPLPLAQAGACLQGRPLDDKDALRRAAQISMDHAAAFAVDNVGSTMDYRIRMVFVLVQRCLEEAIHRALSGEDEP